MSGYGMSFFYGMALRRSAMKPNEQGSHRCALDSKKVEISTASGRALRPNTLVRDGAGFELLTQPLNLSIGSLPVKR